jgi:lipopolysaccharide export LptBFGC system permease protein LptF
VALGFATLLLYYAAVWLSDSYLSAPTAFPILAAWLPNALFLAAAFGLMARSRRAAPL